jgi:AAA15 family ATPase/GTPase
MIKTIQISNYRSIEFFKLNIDEIAGRKCFIFLGRNEAGKSNILKAISTLNQIYPINYELDCNKQGKKEIKNIRVDFELDLSLIDTLKLTSRSLGFPKELFERIKINKLQFAVIGYPEGNISHVFFVYTNKIDTSEYVHDIINEKVILGSSIGLDKQMINKEYLNSNYPDAYKIVDKNLLESLIEKKYSDIVVEMMPDCIYWENSNQYLINR